MGRFKDRLMKDMANNRHIIHVNSEMQKEIFIVYDKYSTTIDGKIQYFTIESKQKAEEEITEIRKKYDLY